MSNKIVDEIIYSLNKAGPSMLNVMCAFKAGKQIFTKLVAKVNPKSKKDVPRVTAYERSIFGDDLIEVVITDETPFHPYDPIEFVFIPDLSHLFDKLKPVSEEFREFLLSQNLKDKLFSQIPLPKLIIEKHFILSVNGLYCDDDFGVIEAGIAGTNTTFFLKWYPLNDNKNVYPSDTNINPIDYYFEVPQFDPAGFINYVNSLKNRPKFFEGLNVDFKIREKMYTGGEDYFEVRIKLHKKDKNNVETIIQSIDDYISNRKAYPEIEEHMIDEYFRYHNFKEIKTDSFTFDLDLGTGDIEELHNIFYLLDETNNIKSVNVTLK